MTGRGDEVEAMRSRCDLGGYIVDTEHHLPLDPTEFHVGLQPVVGCNAIRCSMCGARVRPVADRMLPKNSAAGLYDQEDLRDSPRLRPSPGMRLYLCRCRSRHATHPLALDDPDAEWIDSPNVPWSCGGHPPFALPHVIDGSTVETARDLAELAWSALRGSLPPATHPQHRRAQVWLSRAHLRLADTPWCDTLSSAVVAALDDADPAVRGRALGFILIVELPAGMARALELFQQRRSLFVDVPDPTTNITADHTLEDSVWRAIGPLVARPGPARELARAEALAPGRGRAALCSALAAGDAEWMALHAEAILLASPALGGDLIAIIRGRFPRGVSSADVVARLRAM